MKRQNLLAVACAVCVILGLGRTMYADNGGPSKRGEKVKKQIAFFEELEKKQPKRVERPLKPRVPLGKAALIVETPTAQLKQEEGVGLGTTMEGKELKEVLGTAAEKVAVPASAAEWGVRFAEEAGEAGSGKKLTQTVAKKLSEPKKPPKREEIDWLMDALKSGDVGEIEEWFEDAKENIGGVEEIQAYLKKRIESRDLQGKTLLILAAERGLPNFVEFFLDLDAKVDSPDWSKPAQTALRLAAQNDHAEVVDLLLSKGKAEVDKRVGTGPTALMLAAEKGHADVVTKLLKYGADRHLKDNTGKTARDHAEDSKDEKTIAALVLYQAEPTKKLEEEGLLKRLFKR